MSYFEMFPNILYSAKGDGKFTVMKDILTRVKLVDSAKENILGFDYYEDTNSMYFRHADTENYIKKSSYD